MPIEIIPDQAIDIRRIGDLILQYRAGLTTGIMNARGGFPVQPAILGGGVNPPVPRTIGLTYGVDDDGHERHLEVYHVGGQVYGFIYNAGSAQEQFTYMGNLVEDKEAAHPVGGRNPDKVAAYGFLARKIACMTRILGERLEAPNGAAFRSLLADFAPHAPHANDDLFDLLGRFDTAAPDFNRYLAGLSEEKLDDLEHALNPYLNEGERVRVAANFRVCVGVNRAYAEETRDLDMSLYMVNDRFDRLFKNTRLNDHETKRMLDTFLLVCSEGAKNSLIQQQTISKLINAARADYPTGALANPPDLLDATDPHRTFVRAIITASQNCGNGAINYLDQPLEYDQILAGFGGIGALIDGTVKYVSGVEPTKADYDRVMFTSAQQVFDDFMLEHGGSETWLNADGNEDAQRSKGYVKQAIDALQQDFVYDNFVHFKDEGKRT